MAKKHVDYLPKCNKGEVLASTLLHGGRPGARLSEHRKKSVCGQKGREPSKTRRQSSFNHKSIGKAEVASQKNEKNGNQKERKLLGDRKLILIHCQESGEMCVTLPSHLLKLCLKHNKAFTVYLLNK